MKRMAWLCCTIGVGGLSAVTGCGSSGGPDGGPLQPMGRIIEYVGDGGGSLKPWPAFLPPKPADDALALGGLLNPGAAATESSVPRKQTNWFRLPSRSTSTTMIVTLQPTANEDSDLFLLEASSYSDGVFVLGYSNRTPDGGALDPAGGFAPDWVPLTAGPTGGYPAANVAVLGTATGATPKHFRIEMDIPVPLAVGGPSVTTTVAQYQSRWYSYGSPGGPYTITVTPETGDPDFYAYLQNAATYLGGQIGPGGGSMQGEAYSPAPRYIRVYGFTNTKYTIQITAP